MAGQSFEIQNVPNLLPAIYGLGIQLGALPYIVFNFPISPANIRKEYPGVTTTYQVAGTPAQNGVQKNADVYGIGPPNFIIEGTTGWNRVAATGYLLTGLEAAQTLETLIQDYGQLNATATAAGTQLYTLEFYDYFANSFWEVVPEGPQGFYQDNQHPLLTNYRFRFTGIKNIAGSAAVDLGEADAMAQVFATPAVSAALNAATTTIGLANLYAPGVVSAVTSAVSSAASSVASIL